MDSLSVRKHVEHYQKATSQPERDDLLYQIGLRAEIFTVRELAEIAERGGELSNQQRQRVLGYVEVYLNLNLGGF